MTHIAINRYNSLGIRFIKTTIIFGFASLYTLTILDKAQAGTECDDLSMKHVTPVVICTKKKCSKFYVGKICIDNDSVTEEFSNSVDNLAAFLIRRNNKLFMIDDNLIKDPNMSHPKIIDITDENWTCIDS